MLCSAVEESHKTEQWAQGVGGEIPRRTYSEGAVQEHEERHRGWEKVAGPHSGQTSEGGEYFWIFVDSVVLTCELVKNEVRL